MQSRAFKRPYELNLSLNRSKWSICFNGRYAMDCLGRNIRQTFSSLIGLLLILTLSFGFLSPIVLVAQEQQREAQNTARAQDLRSPIVDQRAPFRLETLPVANGGELLTMWARLGDSGEAEQQAAQEIPLVSVLRDTLGDTISDNDLLRYVWIHTYAPPTKFQRAAATIPFLYQRIHNRQKISPGDTPPPIIDLAAGDRNVWHRVFVSAVLGFLTDRYFLKAAALTYRRNVQDYRRAQVIQALAVLSLYENTTGAPPALSESELREIQARLMLSEKTFGGLIDDVNLQNYYRKQTASTKDVRGRNWELLRQRAEAENLYFEPLNLPDGSVTHALLWVARADLDRASTRQFSDRFLNINNPWTDKRLKQWKGYTEEKHLDAENRTVTADTPGAHVVEMIPLAVYGLDHPKIPALLVDFRDGLNPKKRELTRRAIDDVTQYILSVSAFGDLYYTLGRMVFNFVTGRRGMDVNQPSRVRTYAQLKVLLAMSASLHPALRGEISDRLETVTLNPLQNNSGIEQKLARAQYEGLVNYAYRSGGLSLLLERDRRAEMTKFVHGRGEKALLKLAQVVSLGTYKHREEATPERLNQLDIRRQFAHHTKFLHEVARSTPVIEVSWKIEDVRRSLRFIAEHNSQADDRAARLAARIFRRTEDRQTRELCLAGLKSIESLAAKKELMRLSSDQTLDEEWRHLIANYLNADGAADPPAPSVEAKTSSVAGGQ